MMTDYQIQGPTRKCSVTGRELLPGERFYTALLEEQGKLVRRDYSAEAWKGPPDGAFSFWAGRLPTESGPRKQTINEDVLLECFERLEDAVEPSRISFRYILALLLMRRKRLKFEEAKTEQGQEYLTLRCIRTRRLHHVLNPHLSEDELLAVQQEVFSVLGWE